MRRDGWRGSVDRHVDILQTGPAPPSDAPLVVQLSRWDRLKDVVGFAEQVTGAADVLVVLAGPAVTGVADDPESTQVLDDCIIDQIVDASTAWC